MDALSRITLIHRVALVPVLLWLRSKFDCKCWKTIVYVT